MRTPLCPLLGIEEPILQGGMAWIADASLAGAVSFTFRHSHRPSSIEIFDCVKVRFISPPSSRT